MTYLRKEARGPAGPRASLTSFFPIPADSYFSCSSLLSSDIKVLMSLNWR